MSKILLIHGSSIGVTYSFLRGDRSIDGGFYAFQKSILLKDISLFSWYLKKQHFTFLQSINPWTSAKLYLQERDQIQSSVNIAKLESKLKADNPQIIVAHSLGCHYLLNYLNSKGLPSSVTRICLINSEAPHNLNVSNQQIIERIQAGSLVIDNYFFSWDLTLLSSTLLTGQFCGGILGSRSPHIRNHFKFIPSFSNWHNSMIENDWLKMLLDNPIKLTNHRGIN